MTRAACNTGRIGRGAFSQDLSSIVLKRRITTRSALDTASWASAPSMTMMVYQREGPETILVR